MADRERPSYDVRVWKTDKYEGKQVTTYRVRWAVAGQSFRRGHRTVALAESFRAQLTTAARKGEAFDVASGLPQSILRRQAHDVSWFEFACSYVDMKWPNASPKHRKSIAESLVTITMALLTSPPKVSESRTIRSALANWAFNKGQRGSSAQPVAVTAHIAWVSTHSRAVVDLADPAVLRALVGAFAVKIDGGKASARTAALKRTILSNALDYATERGILASNPLVWLKWSAPKASSGVVDRRVVVNPDQARALLAAVAVTPRNGKRLAAFFGCMYYSALRPEEAVSLRRSNLTLPAASGDYGWLTLDRAAPENGRRWSDNDQQRHERQLKHRAVGDTRLVPCPPDLVVLLRTHLEEFGTDADGRLFQSEKGEQLSSGTYAKLWGRARAAALTEEQAASPLARRPYDLRHAAVSTWLNGGVAPTQVAEWAGHSVAVLLRVYAKCIDGQEQQALLKMSAALNPDSTA